MLTRTQPLVSIYFANTALLPDADWLREHYMAPTYEFYFTAVVDRHARTRAQFLKHSDLRSITPGYHLLRDCLLMVDGTDEWYHLQFHDWLPWWCSTATWAMDCIPMQVFALCRRYRIQHLIVHSVDEEEFDDFRFYKYRSVENDIDVL